MRNRNPGDGTGAEERFVTGTLLPTMGIAGYPFTLAPPPDLGTRSSLHLVRIEGMPPLLLRTFARRRQAATNAEALRHMESVFLQAPRLVYHDPSLAKRLSAAPGPFYTVETWIEGTRLSNLDPESSRAASIKVAELLARFHGVTRAGWGRPSAARVLSFVSYTLLGVRRMVRGLQAHGWIEPDEAREMHAAFGGWSESIGAMKAFNLVHNDANRHNFVLTPAGEVMAVDLQRIAYEPFPEEIINALYHLCRKDEDLGERFLRAYFSRAGASARSTFEATRGFFEPLHYLKKMYRRATQHKIPAADPKMIRWRAIARQIAAAGSR